MRPKRSSSGKRLRRRQVLEFFKALPPCLIGMEACATAHYWARELTKLGHRLRLMPAKDVKAYVKRNKNDAADAEAICEAVRRPTMRFVGNTGSGKSFTVASLLRAVIENEHVCAANGRDPHIFILDINGEYANAFLSNEERAYAREPNEAYVNGRKFSVPIWLMNSEEVCEWLSASEQTQQPVLKAWWAFLKGKSGGEAKAEADFLAEALAAIQRMYPLNALSKNQARALYLAITDFLSGTDLDLKPLEGAIKPYLTKQQNGEYKTFYGDPVDNGVAINAALMPLIAAIEEKISKAPALSESVRSGDTPTYFSTAALRNTATLAATASQEEASQIDQHLTTLRMRLKTRLADRRWSVFTNYDELEISSTSAWFKSLGFEGWLQDYCPRSLNASA
jgi:hypothetical protein